ncbi:MAG: non-homologous end-joining DNA ligase [Nanoarchaeota archaeon]
MNIEGIEIKNPDKLLFPKSKIKKIDVLNYYSEISEHMLPYLENRFLAFQRFPEGITKQGFYQKNTPNYYPRFIQIKKFHEVNYAVCNNKKSLIYLANQASIIFHGWLSLSDKINFPDKLIFDIDPENNPVSEIVKVSFAIKKILESIGLKPYPMATGSRGVHIIIPLKKQETFNEVRNFAKRIAQIVVKLNPNKFTTEFETKKRNGRIFIDIYRNSMAQLSVIPFSIRPIEGAPIACPITWTELKENFNPQKYNLKNIFSYDLQKVWKDFFKSEKSIKESEKKLKSLEI